LCKAEHFNGLDAFRDFKKRVENEAGRNGRQEKYTHRQKKKEKYTDVHFVTPFFFLSFVRDAH
jgi:hypothetical protein